MYIYVNISLNSSYSEKCYRQTLNIKSTHILCSATFCLQSCSLWDSVAKYGEVRQTSDDSVIRRMRIACQITKARIQTLRLCNNHCYSTAIMVTRTHLQCYVILRCLFSYLRWPTLIRLTDWHPPARSCASIQFDMDIQNTRCGCVVGQN